MGGAVGGDSDAIWQAECMAAADAGNLTPQNSALPTWHGCVEEAQLAISAGRRKHQARGVPCHCLQHGNHNGNSLSGAMAGWAKHHH